MRRRRIRLRATWSGSPPATGTWLLSANNAVAYRVIATEDSSVTCVRYKTAEVPAGARLRPWAEVTKPRQQPTVRDYRRPDQLQLLLRRGVISEREYASAVLFRATLEHTTPAMPVASGRLLHVPGSRLGGPDDRHIRARNAIERAIGAVGRDHIKVLDWCVVGNGTVSGYARHVHVREATATDRLRDALGRLDTHYNPPVTGVRR